MPLGRSIVKGLVYTIDLSKIADRENPRTVEAPFKLNAYTEPVIVDWGDGTSETMTSGAFPVHTYAEGIGDVFRVTVRNSTGHIPEMSFSNDQNATVVHNLTLAVTSVDHFGGWTGGATVGLANAFRNTANLQFCDPHISGVANSTSFSNVFSGSGISQPLHALNFEFCTQATYFSSCFNGCVNAIGSTPKLPESAIGIISAFQGCVNLDGEITPLPSSITAAGYAFYNCRNLTGNYPSFPSATGSLAFAFYECNKLNGKIPDIADGVTSIQNTFYQNRAASAFPDNIAASITDVRNAFYNCQTLNVSTNAAPELWDTGDYPSISQSSGCFYGLTNLSNYADIPSGWK